MVLEFSQYHDLQAATRKLKEIRKDFNPEAIFLHNQLHLSFIMECIRLTNLNHKVSRELNSTWLLYKIPNKKKIKNKNDDICHIRSIKNLTKSYKVIH